MKTAISHYVAERRAEGERLWVVPDMLDMVHLTLTLIMAWFSWSMLTPKRQMVGAAWTQFLALAPEETWGFLFAAAAAIGVLGMLAYRWSYINAACTFALATAHGCLAICFYMSAVQAEDPTRELPTAVGTYAFIALLGYALTVRRLLVAFGVLEREILVLRQRS